ncbi:FliI/YscN family ATPase [Microbulbifer sp. JSM ZJ756]|uniref:FliI/YscN family ATPase n=1 Tax=Microbulbifer sp. JSM ZJ756 TaxID=3376191 RepID=UPI0037B531A5
MLEELNLRIQSANLLESYGKVEEFVGLSVKAKVRDAFYGEVCTISSSRGHSLDAEVKGFRDGKVVLLPYGDLTGLTPGCFVRRTHSVLQVPVSDAMLGRVLDGMARPIDSGQPVSKGASRPLRAGSLSPMDRGRINTVLETGVKAVDSMLTIGEGQRIGVFAGAGVGKSSLLGMLTSGVDADITVIALIGERGREVKDFLEEVITPEQRQRTVIIAATADEPAVMRVNAAFTAMAICEFFRDQGKRVFLAMDSLTRLAMAQREVGLAVGEPPTARGYTPSVFALLPELVERAGKKEGAGSITGVYTLLVENEEAEDPVAECARAILDGHIVLNRSIANEGRYPAIDYLSSISRLAGKLQSPREQQLCRKSRSLIKAYIEGKELIGLGAYQEGQNAEVDQALDQVPKLYALFRQDGSADMDRAGVYLQMAKIMGEA